MPINYSDTIPITERLRNFAAIKPDAPCFSFLKNKNTVSDSISYQQLDECARIVAAYLQLQGLQAGDRVIIIYPPGLEFIKTLFGCLYAGVIAVPLYPPLSHYLTQKLINVIKNCKPTLILCADNLLHILDKIKNKIPTHYTALDLANITLLSQWTAQKIPAEQLALLQYTSGSTGMPKGVMVSHENIVSNNRLMHEHYGYTEGDVGVSWLPPYHDMGLIGMIFLTIYSGEHSILMSPLNFLEDPFYWLKAISDYKGVASAAPNFAYAQCVKQIPDEKCASLDLSSWRIAINGAEPIYLPTLEAFIKKFSKCGLKPSALKPCYGLAEATLLVSGVPYRDKIKFIQVDAQSLQENQVIEVKGHNASTQDIVSCGIPIQKVKIIDLKNSTECSENTVGEIWIQGASVTQGYWNQKKLTQELFKAHFKNSKENYLRTGDLGFMHQGELYVCGRTKDMMILNGLNFYPSDLEATINEVLELPPNHLVAFSIPDDTSEKLIILVGASKSTKMGYKKIYRTINQIIFKKYNLQVSSIGITQSGNLLKAANGKIRRADCRMAFINQSIPLLDRWDAPLLAERVQSQRAAKKMPKTVKEMETFIKEQIAVFLDNSVKISLAEPLANYGLTSAVAVQIAARLSRQLKRELSPLLIYEYPSIRALAQYIFSSEKNINVSSTAKYTKPFEPIAIIGMQCKFPGKINSTTEFWSLLAKGREGISDVPASRWDAKSFAMSNKGGFIDKVDKFDAAFFGISPQEAILMDPQQRILLEVVWHALESANINPQHLKNSNTGVYIGVCNHDYENLIRQQKNINSPYAATGNSASACSGRISYQLGLQGPCLSVDTACSSSLVALDIACHHLQSQQCTMAIVGGVNLILTPETSIILSKANMLSPEGYCKVFDATADGYVRSEGCGVVILKPLKAAKKEGDAILGVIRATAVNQDGYTQGFTAPNSLSQIWLMRDALAKAQLKPSDISYIEAHGTGTQLGDPIEISSITQAFKENKPKENKRSEDLLIGSVKSNIGHLESAAGIAGLIKVILSLQNQAIPANLHFKQCNPLINLDILPAKIPIKLEPWKKSKKPRRAAINSFGFTGTNAHVIIEEPPVTSKRRKKIPFHIFHHKSYWVNLPIEKTLVSILQKPLEQHLRESLHTHKLLKKNQDELLKILCCQYIAKTLKELGYKPKKAKPRIVHKAQLNLLTHFLSLSISTDFIAAQKSPKLNADELCQQYPEAELEIRLAQRCGENLSAVMLGDINPLTLLFPVNSHISAEFLYVNSLLAKSMNELLQQSIAILLKTHFQERKNLRILEIGAGTGGATHSILPIITEQVDLYQFTDISAFFLDMVQHKFLQYPFMQYSRLDIEQNPSEQGFTSQQFDIIIAANVLHATKDIKQSLEHIHSLLTPNGTIILMESTEPSVWLDITFGLLEGWWHFSDKALRPNYPLLSIKKWKKVLTETNFTNFFSMTYPTSTKQSLIIAQNNINTTETYPIFSKPLNTSSPTFLPVTSSEYVTKIQNLLASVNPEEYAEVITHELQSYVAAMLHSSVHKIDTKKDFRELGIDSLMAIELFNTLQQAIGTSLILSPATLLEYPNIESLTQFIAYKLQEHDKKTPEVSSSKQTSFNVIFPVFKPHKD